MVDFCHSEVFPNDPLNIAIVGGSGSGKTRLLFQMLTTEGMLDYESLYIYTTTKEQPYYMFLEMLTILSKEQVLSMYLEYEHIIKDIKKNKRINIKARGEKTNIIDIVNRIINREVDKIKDNKPRDDIIQQVVITNVAQDIYLSKVKNYDKKVVVFDDCIEEKDQQLQQSYFLKGRHFNVVSIYLSQSFFTIDKIIRKNVTFFIFFKLPPRAISVAQQDINHGLTPEKFKEKAITAWTNEHGYIAIDITKNRDNTYDDIFIDMD